MRFHGFVVLADELSSLPALQLAAPDAAKVQVRRAVFVDERRGVDAEAAFYGLGFWLEWSFGFVAGGYTNAEDTLLVAGREEEVVFPVLAGGIRGPELFLDPGYVILLQGYAVVCNWTTYFIHAEDVVIVHVILVAVVVILDVCLTIVRGVDIQLAIEDVGRWVGGENVCDDGFFVRHDVKYSVVCIWNDNWKRQQCTMIICRLPHGFLCMEGYSAPRCTRLSTFTRRDGYPTAKHFAVGSKRVIPLSIAQWRYNLVREG